MPCRSRLDGADDVMINFAVCGLATAYEYLGNAEQCFETVKKELQFLPGNSSVETWMSSNTIVNYLDGRECADGSKRRRKVPKRIAASDAYWLLSYTLIS